MKQFFAEKDGELSMKRLCGFICVVALSVSLTIKPTETVVISVASLACAALGFTSAEKIFKRK